MEEAALDLGEERHRRILAATIVVFLTGVILAWSWIVRAKTGRPKLRLAPGPRGLPLVGSLLSAGQLPHRSLRELSAKYGPIMFMYLGLRPTLVVCDAALIKEVLQEQDAVFASRPYFFQHAILTYGNSDVGFSPYSAQWRSARKIVNHELLSTSKLRQYSGITEEETMATIQLILQGSESGDAINFSSLISGMTMNIITRMMWGKRHRNSKSGFQGGTNRFDEIIDSLMVMAGTFNLADFIPFLAPLSMKLAGVERKAKTVHKEMDEFLERIICEREEQLSNSSKTATDDDGGFMDVLVKKLANQPSGDSEQLSRTRLKGILLDMIVAGTDSTGSAMDWALAELMRNPDILRRAQDELSRVVGTDRLVTAADIPNLEYLGAVVREVLRRHAPGPLTIPHLSLTDCKVGGYDVPANTTVFVNLYAVHHDPAVWDEPMDFNPDRFLGSDRDFRGQQYEFLPFSAGRRSCPGINLALNTVHLGLARLLHTIDWSLPEGQTPESVDMAEVLKVALSRAKPLFLRGKPRISPGIIASSFPVS